MPSGLCMSFGFCLGIIAALNMTKNNSFSQGITSLSTNARSLDELLGSVSTTDVSGTLHCYIPVTQNEA